MTSATPTASHDAISGADFVFHAAALKQVPSCEFFPEQAVKTNVLGSHNVIEAADAHGVRSVVCLSTDKAVYPVNAMGMSKALMEKTAQAFARNHPNSPTTVSITRYGNVMYSRGSVIPLFIRAVRAEGKPLTVTEPAMTRFLMSLRGLGRPRRARVLPRRSRATYSSRRLPPAPSETLARAVAELFGHGDPEVRRDRHAARREAATRPC